MLWQAAFGDDSYT